MAGWESVRVVEIRHLDEGPDRVQDADPDVRGVTACGRSPSVSIRHRNTMTVHP